MGPTKTLSRVYTRTYHQPKRRLHQPKETYVPPLWVCSTHTQTRSASPTQQAHTQLLPASAASAACHPASCHGGRPATAVVTALRASAQPASRARPPPQHTSTSHASATPLPRTASACLARLTPRSRQRAGTPHLTRLTPRTRRRAGTPHLKRLTPRTRRRAGTPCRCRAAGRCRRCRPGRGARAGWGRGWRRRPPAAGVEGGGGQAGGVEGGGLGDGGVAGVGVGQGRGVVDTSPH